MIRLFSNTNVLSTRFIYVAALAISTPKPNWFALMSPSDEGDETVKLNWPSFFDSPQVDSFKYAFKLLGAGKINPFSFIYLQRKYAFDPLALSCQTF